MSGPALDLVPGESVSKSGLEDALGTKFGYQVRGINIRWGDAPQYIVLFRANRSDAFDDQLAEGDVFRYRGEGIKGDQSRDVPGNKALLDARSDDRPIFVFDVEGGGTFTYVGEAEVEGCSVESHDDREVLVFELRLVLGPGGDQTLPNLFIAPVDDIWQYRNRVQSPLGLEAFDDTPSQFHGQDEVRVWAFDDANVSLPSKADLFQRGDVVLFYHDGAVIGGGRVGQYTRNPAVGHELWNDPCYRHLITIEEFTDDVISLEELFEALPFDERWAVDGFTRVPPAKVAALRDSGDSVADVLFGTPSTARHDATEEGADRALGCDHDEQYKDAINPGITLGAAGFSIGTTTTRVFCHQCNESYATNRSLLSRLVSR